MFRRYRIPYVLTVLLSVGIINVLLYQSYFQQSRHLSINIGRSTVLNFQVSTSRTSVTVIYGYSNISINHVKKIGEGRLGSRNVSKRPDPVGKTGKPLEAWGKVVNPRASVTVPWKRDNTTPCPLNPPNLIGKLVTYKLAPSFTEIVKQNQGLEPGGHYHPANCRARHRVVIIVPYRDREQHLRVLLHNLHPMLMRQQLDYFILVVELAQPTPFNRGMLLNIGAVEALGLWDVQCFIFHDVDLIPENDKNLYTCPAKPRHMSAATDKWNYRLPYRNLIGGVTALSREHLSKVNGFSNSYFGWGGEDDDLFLRLNHSGLIVTRSAMNVARYSMIKHGPDKNNEVNPRRFKMLDEWKKRQATDGLNSLQYEVQKVEFREGYTYMLVNIDMGKVMKGPFPYKAKVLPRKQK